MSRAYPHQNLKQVLLRIPEEMRERLEHACAENSRSLTAEVLARLESTFPADEKWLSKAQTSPVIKLEKRLFALEIRFEDRLEALEAEIRDLKSIIANFNG